MSEIIKNRYEFVLLFDVENGNPNGDPDMGNMPRVDPQTGNGIVTDVCLKRKVRDYVDLVKSGNAGYEIYVKSGAVLNSQHKKAYDYLGINPDSKKPKDDELTKFMCQNFFDIRTFGAVMTTEINCGQVRGPVQFSFARSIDPIFQQEVTVTRCAVTNEKDAEKGQTMGKKQIVPYGLYRAEGYVSAHLAKKTEFTEDDLELLWDSLVNMFEHDHSAARGKMSARKLIVFKHNSELGCCQSHVLFDKVKVERLSCDMPSRSFADYKVTIADDMPNGIELIEKL
ncbi:type I-C CRISPR-associated protein Cas7/Csd2 [Methanosarcina vacuolata]|uniref:CRISPR-associated protein, Csd2 family n=1 Tax=Methanosarcina vacuolata Z-761 TaxID=1434123 RepID=A0A0E3Q6P6_9EURY|nr:type I-C CRISPR-associated protein Cas7/Csd2 [Methanosarcina vacuolata]AKB44513.1 CRISPR-associated protein, Csd2 family [Methanosarcina vacuolata Z-761]